jgi:hypothetical protein
MATFEDLVKRMQMIHDRIQVTESGLPLDIDFEPIRNRDDLRRAIDGAGRLVDRLERGDRARESASRLDTPPPSDAGSAHESASRLDAPRPSDAGSARESASRLDAPRPSDVGTARREGYSPVDPQTGPRDAAPARDTGGSPDGGDELERRIRELELRLNRMGLQERSFRTYREEQPFLQRDRTPDRTQRDQRPRDPRTPDQRPRDQRPPHQQTPTREPGRPRETSRPNKDTTSPPKTRDTRKGGA